MKRPEKNINEKSDNTKTQETQDLAQVQRSQTLVNSRSQEHPLVLPVFNNSPDEDLRNSSPSPVSKLLEELSLDCSITDKTDSAVLNGKAEHQNYLHLNGKETDGGWESLQTSPMNLQNSPVKQKPPAVLKKPKLPYLPPFTLEPVNEQLPSQKEHVITLSQINQDQEDALQRQIKDEEKENENEQQEEEEEGISESTESLSGSSEAFTEVKNESPISFSASQETSLDYELCTNGEAHEEAEEEGDGTSSTTGSISSKEDDAGESDYI